MKKLFFAASMMLIFAVSASAQFKPGIAAGYSLTHNTFDGRGIDVVVSTGFGHGFYVGPTFEYNFGEHAAIEASLLFTRESGSIRVNPYELMCGLNNAYRNVQDKMLDLNGAAAGERMYDWLFKTDETDEAYGNKVKGSISSYDLRIPFVAKLKYGRIGLLAGLYMDLHLFTKIHFNLSIKNDGFNRYTENSFESRYKATEVYYFLGIERMPAGNIDEHPELFKTWDQVWDKGVASRVGFGAIAGAEIYFTDNLGMQITYYHDVVSNLKKEFLPGGKYHGSGLNVGLNYRF